MMFWYYLVATVLLFLFLSKVSTTTKYYIKYIGFCFYCIFLAFSCGLFCLFRPGSSKNVVIAQFFFWLIQFEWMFSFNIQIEDWEKLKGSKKPFVVVSNHQTALDAVILLKASPNGTAPLAKKILLYVPIFGFVSWLCGTVFIDRKKGDKAIETMRKVGNVMKENETSVWIFPEGTRHQQDKIMPFKKGAFHLAVQAQVPIVPVVIYNYRNVIDHGNHLFEGGTIRLKCLDPINTDDMGADDVNSLSDQVHHILSDSFDQDMKSRAESFEKLLPIKTKII